MTLDFKREALTEAEAGLVAWQFSGSEPEHPYVASLWSAIALACDHAASGRAEALAFLARLGAAGAFAAELAVYQRFRGVEGEAYWLDILQRAGLADRRRHHSEVPNDRRRRRPGPDASPSGGDQPAGADAADGTTVAAIPRPTKPS